LELQTLQTNLALMQQDIRLQYQQTLAESHHGRPTIIENIYTGEPGRPRIYIDPDFLRWAYGHRSISGIARFLHVDCSVVRNALLDYGIVQPQADPFARTPSPELNNTDITDDILDPALPIPQTLPDDIIATSSHAPGAAPPHPISFTGPLSATTDDELNELVIRLQSHYCRAGISMLDGMLRHLGHCIPRERIRASLLCIDPVQQVFECICIRQRVYSVPGPNSLWHHDGQHGER
jgi:hypothetical protein